MHHADAYSSSELSCLWVIQRAKKLSIESVADWNVLAIMLAMTSQKLQFVTTQRNDSGFNITSKRDSEGAVHAHHMWHTSQQMLCVVPFLTLPGNTGW